MTSENEAEWIARSWMWGKKKSSRTHEMVTFLRAYRVRKPDTEVIFRTIEGYPEWQPSDDRNVTFIYGERDIQDIIAACRELKSKGAVVIEIEKALHGDIHLLEKTFETVISALGAGLGYEKTSRHQA